MAATGKRTRNAVKNQVSSNSNQTIKLNSLYIGYVKDNSDALKMRRLRVWIPELTPDSVNGLYTVNWCSPHAGATPVQENNNTNDSQVSYGMWFPPPDIDNEVVVGFINGDPNRGVYMGGLYQQNMNHMVPGIPSSNLTDPSENMGSSGPAQEYNRKTSDGSTPSQPRPAYSNLIDGLINQGLGGDSIRGTSTSGARRDDASKVTGILSPGGSQFVMDDESDHSFIRFRTKSGTQIVISDTVGIIYMITKSGNSWLELSDEGIDAYTTGNYSIRSHGDFNIHADGNINMFSGKQYNIASSQGISMSAVESYNLIAGNKLSIASGGQLSIVTTADLNLSGSGNVGVDCGGTLSIRACTEIGISSCDKIGLKSTTINLNSGDVPTPGTASQATVKSSSKLNDRTVTAGGNGSSATTETIVSTLPTHEPYIGHPTTSTSAATITPDTNITTVDKSVTQNTNPTVAQTSTVSDASSTSTQDQITWMYPITGKVEYQYGNKNAKGAFISTVYGQNIISPRKGKILSSGTSNKSSGYYVANTKTVIVDHLDGYYSIISGFEKVSVNKDDSVIQGQTLGTSGLTNNISLIQYQLTKKGQYVDPSTVLPLLKDNKSIVAGKLGSG